MDKSCSKQTHTFIHAYKTRYPVNTPIANSNTPNSNIHEKELHGMFIDYTTLINSQ